MRQLLVPPVALLLVAPLVAADPSPIRKDLDRYYKERLRQPFIRGAGDPEPKRSPPPWEKAARQLAADKAEERRLGAAHLQELLALALADETSRTAPWRNTPYWGGGAELPARDLRGLIAQDLAKAKPSAELVPLLKWYFDHETFDRFLGPISEALGKVDGDAADALRISLVAKPHPNAVVVADALKQLTSRKKPLPADALAALCHHYRSAVRDSARALNAQQGGKDPGQFDAAKALRLAPMARVMDRVIELLPDLPGPKAEFVRVTERHLDDKKVVRRTDEYDGWLVKKEKDAVTIATPYGRRHTFRDGEKKRIGISEASPSRHTLTGMLLQPARSIARLICNYANRHANMSIVFSCPFHPFTSRARTVSVPEAVPQSAARPTPREVRVSPEALRAFASARKTTPAWRWEVAQLRVDHPNLKGLPGDDAWVNLAHAYLRHEDEALASPAGRSVVRAIHVHQSSRRLATLIEAYALARLGRRAIARKLNLSLSTVRVYETLFFDVRKRLNAAGWVMAQAIGACPIMGFTREQFGPLLRWTGYTRGPLVLDVVVAAVTGENPENYAPEILDKARLFVELASLSPTDSAQQLSLLRVRMEADAAGAHPSTYSCPSLRAMRSVQFRGPSLHTQDAKKDHEGE